MAEDKYNIRDPEDLMVCPYNKSHMIRSKRFPYHLMKCRREYTGLEYENCPFNARHEIPKQELRYHIANCPDKARIESDLAYEQQKNDPESQYYKGCTDIPNYKQADENLPPPTENWDRECPTAIRIGVDPNYLYSNNKFVNTMGLAPSQKKQLSQYFLNRPTAEEGQTSIRNIIDSYRQQIDESRLDASDTGDRVRLPRTTPALLEQVEKHRITTQPPNLYAYSLSTAGVGRGRGRGITTPTAGLMNGLGGATNAGDSTQLMLAMSRGRGLMNYSAVSAPGALNRAGAASQTQSLTGQDDMDSAKTPSVNGQYDMDSAKTPSVNGQDDMDSAKTPSVNGLDDMDSCSSTSEYDVEKEARKIRKKLRQIMMLEKRALAGEQLNSSELAKVSKKAELTEALNELSMD